MATLKVIRKRITSVKNTQKITKAMKMVAAAKLRRAQTALVQARPYNQHLLLTLSRLLPALKEGASPYLRRPEKIESAELMVYTSDRGLCGGFNSNLLRRVQQFLLIDSEGRTTQVSSIGKKGRDFFRAKKISLKEEVTGSAEAFNFASSVERAKGLLEDFVAGKFDAYSIAYNGFKSAISQEISIKQVLPLDLPLLDGSEALLPVIYEPAALELFEKMLPLYLASQLHLAHLESAASELGARMSAMENATNNAKEMIGKLTLQYNRARQASITKELMDIVNGAESLK